MLVGPQQLMIMHMIRRAYNNAILENVQNRFTSIQAKVDLAPATSTASARLASRLMTRRICD